MRLSGCSSSCSTKSQSQLQVAKPQESAVQCVTRFETLTDNRAGNVSDAKNNRTASRCGKSAEWSPALWVAPEVCC